LIPATLKPARKPPGTWPINPDQEGLAVAISVVAQVRDLTAEEDAALLQALNLEGSPPGGGRIRLAGPGGRRAAPKEAKLTTSVFVRTGSSPRSGASAARCS
jgi:hypothetical protein